MSLRLPFGGYGYVALPWKVFEVGLKRLIRPVHGISSQDLHDLVLASGAPGDPESGFGHPHVPCQQSDDCCVGSPFNWGLFDLYGIAVAFFDDLIRLGAGFYSYVDLHVASCLGASGDRKKSGGSILEPPISAYLQVSFPHISGSLEPSSATFP